MLLEVVKPSDMMTKQLYLDLTFTLVFLNTKCDNIFESRSHNDTMLPDSDVSQRASKSLDNNRKSIIEMKTPNSPPSVPILVDFDGPDDPEHPHHWSIPKKISFITIVSAKIFVVSFSSSVLGPATGVISKEFNVEFVVAQLCVALFMAGFAVGPLVFGPLSEVIGNSPPMIVGCILCALLQIPAALTNSIVGLLFCRFLAGATGSAVLGVGTGMVAELYTTIPRATALAFSVSMINLGSTVGPIAGAYIVDRYNWRWTFWTTLIMSFALEPFACFALRESSPKRILAAKAKRLRSQGKQDAFAAGDREHIDARILLTKYFLKPLKLICKEPILIILTIHLTFVYGTLYLAYQVLPKAFRSRGWDTPTSNLPFIAVTLGALTAPFVIVTYTMTWYSARFRSRNSVIISEDRLPPMILGAAGLPIGILWFGWSGNVHWFCQVMAGWLIGLSVLLVFISGITYLVDVYPSCSNSAVSIHVVIRSVVAASFALWV